MENMRTRFVIAVTGRLSAAADTTAKVELIEELSENLYSRWQDLVAGGMDSGEAYEKALEDLGNVDELLAYLDGIDPEPPRQEARDFTSELLHGVEDVVRETVHQTRDAVDQAAVIVRNVADKLKEKYPDGFKGKIYVRFDGDEDGKRREEREARDAGREAQDAEREAEREARDAEREAAADVEEKEKGWSFSLGYNRNKGGFFCETGRTARRVEGTSLSSQGVKGVDVQIVNGDISIRMDSDPQADIRLDGDLENLDVRLSDDGVLSVRQGNTASSSFLFLRGLAAADVELSLPRRFWDFVQLSSTNGDVDVDEGLEAGRLSVKTVSGDTEINGVEVQDLVFHSASGDLDAGHVTSGNVRVDTSSGDIQLSGSFGAVQAGSISGDIDLTGGLQELRCSSTSGDVCARLNQVPQHLESSSKSGDCEIAMPGGEGFTLQFSTVSGELDSAFPLVGPIGTRSGEAIYLDGGGRTFRISTFSGDITLRQS